MSYVILVTTDNADPDVFGPYPTEDYAEAAIPRAWADLAASGVDAEAADASVCVLPLRAPL